jgi:hypothetical protein
VKTAPALFAVSLQSRSRSSALLAARSLAVIAERSLLCRFRRDHAPSRPPLLLSRQRRSVSATSAHSNGPCDGMPFTQTRQILPENQQKYGIILELRRLDRFSPCSHCCSAQIESKPFPTNEILGILRIVKIRTTASLRGVWSRRTQAIDNVEKRNGWLLPKVAWTWAPHGSGLGCAPLSLGFRRPARGTSSARSGARKSGQLRRE